MASSSTKPHVIIFPFMAHGHTLPLLDLSKALSTQNIKVTILTTPSNSNQITNCITNDFNISITEFPFPTFNGLCIENTSQLPSMELFFPFVEATKQLRKPFEQFLRTMLDSRTPPLCVVSDFFLGWTLDVCRAFRIPRLVFHGMSVLSMAIAKSARLRSIFVSESGRINLPEMKLPFDLTKSDMPCGTLKDASKDSNDPFEELISEVEKADVNSWGVIVNSFEELERSHITSLESFYGKAKAWCVGPLHLYNKIESFNASTGSKSDLMLWLSEQVSPDSVIYVSFGTQAHVSDAQLDEVAFGLCDSGCPFIWVVRSKTWSLPNELVKKIKGKGIIVEEWVDQRKILLHRAIGGFLSHCGWNSVLESVTAGVPILAWPMIAEQGLNAKLVVDGLGGGLSLKKIRSIEGEGVEVLREGISEGVKELMGGEKGRNARERVEALGRVSRRSVQHGGSSNRSLHELINRLGACHGETFVSNNG